MRANVLESLRRRLTEAQAEIARWQERIDNAPAGTTNHQLGVWQGKRRDAERRVGAIQDRIRKEENQ